MRFDELKFQVSSKLKDYKVYFSPDEVPADIFVNEDWKYFGLIENKSANLPAAWDDFSDRLPWVCDWLRKCVVGTVLAVSDKSYLGYIYMEDGQVYIYLGGEPLKNRSVVGRTEVPHRIFDFYSKLHNGFGFYIGMTMGPSPVEDFICLQDLCDEDLSFLPRLVSFFSSGAGDYLAMGMVSEREIAYVWWHEEPTKPEVDIDFWAVMNTWMSIFLENCDSN